VLEAAAGSGQGQVLTARAQNRPREGRSTLTWPTVIHRMGTGYNSKRGRERGRLRYSVLLDECGECGVSR